MMKKLLSVFLVLMIVLAFGAFAVASGSDDEDKAPSAAQAENTNEDDNSLGKYSVEIKSCRLAKDYEGKSVVIVTYVFTNNDDEATSFWLAIDHKAYQNGIGLNDAYILDDSANFNDDNYMKEIKKGTTLEVERAYKLNDTTTDVEVEAKKQISFDDTTIRKVFKITG